MFFNRYFGSALLGFWFLLYNHLWAILPSLPFKAAWALSTCLVIGGAATYSLSRSADMVAMEETALLKLRKLIAAYLTRLRDATASSANGIVIGSCTAVSTLAQSTCLLVVVGILAVADTVKQSVFSVFLTAADAVQYVGTLLGFGANAVFEALQPLVDTMVRLSSEVLGAISAAAINIYKHRTGLVLLSILLDLALPFNMIGHANTYARAVVLDHFEPYVGLLIVATCVVVHHW